MNRFWRRDTAVKRPLAGAVSVGSIERNYLGYLMLREGMRAETKWLVVVVAV